MPAASPWYCGAVVRRLEIERARRVERDGGGIERDGAHVHGRGRRVVGERRRHESAAASGVDHELVASPSPSRAAIQARHRMPLPLISASPPSALRSSIAQSAPSAPGRSVIRPSAPTPRWRSQSARDRGVGRADAVESDDDEEVVPGPMELRDVRHALHLASRAGSSAHGLSTVANHAMRGSRLNHMRWRRANDRVRRVTVANASSRPLCPSRWASSSL